ncbi:MAG TPA: DUF1614 domain-containing protein [Candidatus Bathyarchaeota archaeon]|nr:DUF1614 domain-containing protein [Candidatus Bathyarchaeota archaeon]
MFESEEESRQKVFMYNPISLLYLIFLGFLTLFILPFLIFAGALVGRALSLPSYLVFVIFLLSLFGSQVNIKLKETECLQPTLTYKTVDFFGIQWRLPQVGYGNKKMVIAINLGGAVIPLLMSLFILFYSVPALEQNLTLAYLKILVAFIVVTFVVHRFAKPIRGLGIAIPSFIPPLTAALTSAALFSLGAETNPFLIAYVAGTLGTLVGADLLNLNKIPKLGAPMVSIGGAGVFDGVYMTGVMAILLLWLIV